MNNAEATNMFAKMMFHGQSIEKNKKFSFMFYKKTEMLGYKYQDQEYSEIKDENDNF